MDTVINQIINRGITPTRQDIADLLASIGKPGEKRDEKTDAVRRLFEELGHHGMNIQGHHVADDLDDWEAF